MVFSAPPVAIAHLKKSGHSVEYYTPPKISDKLKSRKTRHTSKHRKRNIWRRQTYSQEAINQWRQKANFPNEGKIRTERVRREPTLFDDLMQQFSTEASGSFSENVSEVSSQLVITGYLHCTNQAH